MIITLSKADFSLSNIGTLSSFRVYLNLGNGATSSNTDVYVSREAAYNTVITLADGYELGSEGVTVTMGSTVLSEGITITDNTIGISIGSVTGNIVIKVSTVNSSTGEEDSGNDNGGNNSDNETTNLLSLGTLTEQSVTTSTTDPTIKKDTTYFTYSNVPVSANTTYISPCGRRTFYLDSSHDVISQENINSLDPQWIFTTPANCAYVTISYKYSDIAVADTTLTVHTT